MSRELNKELFGPNPLNKEASPRSAAYTMRQEFEVTEEDWKLMKSQLEHLKRKNTELQNQLDMLNSRMKELMGAAKIRIDRVGAASQRIEEAVKSKFQELSQKFSGLTSKVNERKMADHKIEELVGRHNQALQGFEVRNHQLQKLVSEQEMQLMNYKAALGEAQREIARLKRF